MKKEDYNSREHYNAAKREQSNSNRPKSLAEQLAELNKSPEQKRIEQPWHEWCKDLYHYVSTSKYSCSLKTFNYVQSKYKAEFENFKKKGTKFSDIINFVNSKAEDLREF